VPPACAATAGSVKRIIQNPARALRRKPSQVLMQVVPAQLPSDAKSVSTVVWTECRQRKPHDAEVLHSADSNPKPQSPPTNRRRSALSTSPTYFTSSLGCAPASQAACSASMCASSSVGDLGAQCSQSVDNLSPSDVNTLEADFSVAEEDEKVNEPTPDSSVSEHCQESTTSAQKEANSAPFRPRKPVRTRLLPSVTKKRRKNKLASRNLSKGVDKPARRSGIAARIFKKWYVFFLVVVLISTIGLFIVINH